VKLNLQEYRDQVLGCWLGKNIGGTLGLPFEWWRQVNDVSFYTQKLAGEPVPNDDLDAQVLWLVALEQKGITLNARTLAEYWCKAWTMSCSEYGTARMNLVAGIPPPFSGSTENVFMHSCGAFIRSEIWACIAPGLPRVAAHYAYEDGIIDHGNGEGTWAEIFMAVLESTAFVIKDIPFLVEIGLSYLPEDCGVAGAVRCVMQSHREGRTALESRDQLLEKFRGGSFMNWLEHTSTRDREKGFHTGTFGWDAPSNIGIILVGLLYGGGDFEKSICLTVNCGEDADCTGASVGALFGILHGARKIPEKWIAPIGRKIITANINWNYLGGGAMVHTVDDLTARTENIARQVLLRCNPECSWDAETSHEIVPTEMKNLPAGRFRDKLVRVMRGTLHVFDGYDITIDYGTDGAFVRDGVPKTLRLHIESRDGIQTRLNIRWLAGPEWNVVPGRETQVAIFPWYYSADTEVEFQISAQRILQRINHLVIELTVPGQPTLMLIPIVLLNGNLQPIQVSHLRPEWTNPVKDWFLA
jgi:ADP-ribosylglycohydrolase